jgi:hypothetical protein
VGRGLQLPKFAHALALPAAHRRRNFFGRAGVGRMVLEGPAAELGAGEFEVVEAERFRGDKAVGGTAASRSTVCRGGPERVGARARRGCRRRGRGARVILVFWRGRGGYWNRFYRRHWSP